MIDPVDIIRFEGSLKIQKMIKTKCTFDDIKKEFRHIEESVLFKESEEHKITICMMRYQTGIKEDI